MSRPARVDEEGMVETGFDDDYNCGECEEWIYNDDMKEWMCRYAIHDARNDPKHPACHFIVSLRKTESERDRYRRTLEILAPYSETAANALLPRK